MNPLIKWPGGKSGEIQKIRQYIPEYDRYVEPFFGGGALFFHLRPRAAAINDISGSLMEYYTLIQQQDEQLRDLLLCYSDSFSGLWYTQAARTGSGLAERRPMEWIWSRPGALSPRPARPGI